MKHTFIAPINYLHLIPENENFHLTLAHLFENQVYSDFYKQKKERGDFILMDNSAFEYKEALSKEFLLSILEKIPFIPDVVVLPDYPFQDYQKTVDSAYESIEFFKQNYSPIKFMYVPQSLKGDLQGWLSGYKEASYMKDVSFIGLSILNIPMAFCKETGTEDISFNRIYAMAYLQSNNLILKDKNYHCLGLGSNIRELKIMQQYSFIYSNDSSSAIWHGINGISYDDSSTGLFLGKIKKEVDFLYPYNTNRLDNIKFNINYIKNLIGDGDMKKFNNYIMLKESYVKKLFEFPELDLLTPSQEHQLDKLFQQRDNLVEDVMDGSISITEWMDFGSVNTFKVLLESESFLIQLLSRAHKLTKKEKQIQVLTTEILHILKSLK